MLDDMTHTLSSDFFNYLLNSEGKRAIRYTYFFSLLMVEMDQIEEGAPLSTLADLIRQCVRNTDVIGRTDEKRFSVILHHSEVPSTHSVGERIRDRVENHNFGIENSQQKRTVSVGGACFPTHTPDIAGLLMTAHEMLLRAKSHGGNKVFLPEIDRMA